MCENIISIIENNKGNFSKKNLLLYNKFRLWQSYIKKIKESKNNPYIIAMAFTQKLIAYTGIIESADLGDEPMKKFSNFFTSKLDEHEKFLLMMGIQIGKTEEERRKREEKIVDSYLENSIAVFDSSFKKTIDNLYGLRCRMVHQGEFVIASILGTESKILPYFSPNMELKIDEDIVSLDEIFLRGFCRIVNIESPTVIIKVKKFLKSNWYASGSEKYFNLFKRKFNL